MNWRGLLIGVLVVAGLAAAVFLVVRRDRREGRRELAELVFPYNTRDVAEISITHELGRARFHRSASGWERVDGDETARADVVPELIASWSRIRYLEVVEENPSGEDLERFGLASPGVRLEARLAPGAASASGGRTPRIELGRALPLSPGYYARVDGFERVVGVSPEAIDLRDGVGRELFGETSVIRDAGGH